MTNIKPFDRELAEALCDLQIPRAIKLSPDASQVVYSTNFMGSHKKGKNHISTLWISSTSVERSARKLTSGEFNDCMPTWHPDGTRVAFLSDRSNPGEDMAIWVLRLDGGDAVRVSPAEEKAAISSFKISPDGTQLAYVSCDEVTLEDKKRKDDGETEPIVWGESKNYSRLRVIDLAGTKSACLSGLKEHVDCFAWTPDSKCIVYSSAEDPDLEEPWYTGISISTVAVATREKRLHHQMKQLIADIAVGDSNQIYYTSSTDPSIYLSGQTLYLLDTTSTSGPVKIVSGEDEDVNDFKINNGKVLISRLRRLENTITDLQGTQLFSRSTDFFSWDAVWDDNSDSWVIAAQQCSINDPFEVIIARTGHNDIQLSNLGASLNGRRFGSCKMLESKSLDGKVELDGMFLAPAAKINSDGSPSEPLPTAVLIHGGPNDRDIETFGSQKYWAEYLVAQGYAVLLPQYRGSYGRGREFAQSTFHAFGEENYNDVISITDDAVKRGYSDPERLLVGGWSNGGLLTFICSVRNGMHGLGWRFKASIPGAGICDIDSLVMTSDAGSTVLAEFNAGSKPWTVPKTETRGRQASALWEIYAAVEESKRTGQMVIPPMLILHGDADNRVPYSQSVGMARALRMLGLPHEFVSYPGQGHGIARRVYWIDMLQRVSRWCDTYIGPA